MRAIAMGIGCVALAIAGVSAAVAAVGVPRVIGQTESAAQCALAKVGLRWRFRGAGGVRSRPIIGCAPRTAVTPDPKVLSQSPRAGVRVNRGAVVILDDECLRRVRAHHPGCA